MGIQDRHLFIAATTIIGVELIDDAHIMSILCPNGMLQCIAHEVGR